MDWDCWNNSEDFGCFDSLDMDVEKHFDDLSYTSFDRQFHRLYQFCSDGMFDPDLAIFYLNKMSQSFHRFWYDCFVHSLDIMEIILYD